MNNAVTEALYKYNKPRSVKHSRGNGKVVMNIRMRKHQKEGKEKKGRRELYEWHLDQQVIQVL